MAVFTPFCLFVFQARLMATIGVTRGLGDHDLKVYSSNIHIKPFLSCCPEVSSAGVKQSSIAGSPLVKALRQAMITSPSKSTTTRSAGWVRGGPTVALLWPLCPFGVREENPHCTPAPPAGQVLNSWVQQLGNIGCLGSEGEKKQLTWRWLILVLGCFTEVRGISNLAEKQG